MTCDIYEMWVPPPKQLTGVQLSTPYDDNLFSLYLCTSDWKNKYWYLNKLLGSKQADFLYQIEMIMNQLSKKIWHLSTKNCEKENVL